ncbi:hypothetical protein HD806DRAFT_481117 [Xylariaceae sp. AK1471]|nr:hypothetical protein HD806DRAFT_481117 [Xylariaceae sp. AK1471]
MISAHQFFLDIKSTLPRTSYVNLPPILEGKVRERHPSLLMCLAEGRRAAEILVPQPDPPRPYPVGARPSIPSPPPSPPPSLGANQPLNPPPVSQADQNAPCNTLYVGNLPIDTSEDKLKAIFSKQSGYKRLCFRTKQNGPMCYVEFEDISSATKALHDLNMPLRSGVKGGICINFSKNSLGVRSALSKAPDDHTWYKLAAGQDGMADGDKDRTPKALLLQAHLADLLDAEYGKSLF